MYSLFFPLVSMMITIFYVLIYDLSWESLVTLVLITHLYSQSSEKPFNPP